MESKSYPVDKMNIKSITKHLTGGRPMTNNGLDFIDVVSGKSVHYYRDSLGRRWMSDGGPWSLFRIKTVNQ